MKFYLFLIIVGVSISCFAQEVNKQSLKNLFNEFQISVNYGAANPRTFFGVGIGASHVFRSDRALGSRVGLEVDFFHFWSGEITPPYSNDVRKNQHYYSTNVSVPFALQLNFGNQIRFLFELGGRLGVNAHTFYRADVFQTASDSSLYGKFESQKTTMSLGPFLGLNSGVGISIPLTEKYNLLLKPDVGLNMYAGKPAFAIDISPIANFYIRMNIGLRFRY